jgi:ATP/maltotriose-dependent transcriptional regulator MalT
LLERQVAMSRPGALRGQALSLLSWVNLGDCNLTDAVRLARQALDEADDDDSLRALTLLRLGIVESIRGDLHVALDHVRSAIRVTEAGDDVALLAAALAYVGYLEVLRGHGIAPEARRAVELERSVTDFMGQFTASMTLGQVLMYSGALDEARDVLEETLTRAVVAGDEEARAALLFHLGDLERRAGRWERAMPLAREASSLYRESGNDQEYYSSLCPLELLEAGLGSLDEAQSLATEGLEAALRMGDETFAIHHRGILGFIELSRGNAAEACEWLRPAADALVRREVREVSIYPVFQNEIDALVATGELAQAERRVELLEAYASETGRSWTRVIAGRGRGLLLAATGDLDAARAALEAALHAEGGTGEPLERARTLLALGVVERRAKRKRPSREALDGARAIFAGLPAPVWVRRVDAELDRLGLRVGEDALTETEARVAALAAAGRTNPEIAAEVFISRKTVEATLSRVYRKLGVRSRVELARVLPPSEQ